MTMKGFCMRVLLAATDRDLLDGYRKLLPGAFGECVTAFDGAQVLADLAGSEGKFDLVILDHALPRISTSDILRQLHLKNVPSIVLLDSTVTAHHLAEEPLPCAFLSHPFLPEDLIGLMENILCKAASCEHFFAGGIAVDVSAFRLEGGPRLTAIEIDLLYALANKTSSDVFPEVSGIGAAVSALNEKFAVTNAPVRIRYLPKKGFELVNTHE